MALARFQVHPRAARGSKLLESRRDGCEVSFPVQCEGSLESIAAGFASSFAVTTQGWVGTPSPKATP